MANNYDQFSEMIHVPEDKKHAVIEFLAQWETDINDGQFDFFGGIDVTFPYEDDGKTYLWLRAEESYMDEELEYIVQGTLKAIDSDLPVTVSCAYTCSKMRPGEFGGGVYAIWKDRVEYADGWTVINKLIKEDEE